MKLFFLKDHSLYKIFKTLEKVPCGKTIHIHIDPEHAFFDNEWWGFQIKDLIEKRNLHAAFVTKTEKARRFFEKVGLPVIHHQQHPILKVLNLLYLFFFNIKNFHLEAYTKKNSIFYVIFSIEIAFIALIFYLLGALIIPKTIVEIYPSTQTENIIYNFRYYPYTNLNYPKEAKNLSIPYHTGFIDYKYTMSISVNNIKHIQNPSAGTVTINNTTDNSYNLLKGTRFETEDGLVFVAKNWFKLPPKSNISVAVVANEQDNQGTLMGSRGNISKGTKLYIRNLKESFFLKSIVATSDQDFSGGKLTSQGTVGDKDIEILSGKLIKAMQEQKLNLIDQNFSLSDSLVLRFNSLTDLQILSLSIDNKAKDRVPYVQGSIVVRISFMYINQKDLESQIQKYLSQRAADNRKLLTVDKKSLVFFDSLKKDNLGAYIIPTKISTIESYDFEKDVNGIVDDIKTKIVGMEKTKAKEVLFSYPEISSSTISIRPPRYSVITKLKSRIAIKIK